jgi:hypothetical protein
MDMPYASMQLELAYCMGVIVGEGCFSGDRTAPALVLALHVDDPQPLLDLRSVFGGSIYGPYVHNGRHFRKWILRSWQLAEALPYIERWLPPSRKREQYIAWRARFADYFERLESRVSRQTVTRRSRQRV